MKKRNYLMIVGMALLILSCKSGPKKDTQSTTGIVKNIKATSKMHKTISKDGTEIAFWESGSGLPLLFVHGMTADHNSWFKIAPLLEHYFTIYVMDRRGRGESGDSPEYEFMREVEDIVAVVESIGEPVFLFGHSYGALCSLETALLTDKIKKLILYEPPLPGIAPQIPPDIPDRIQTLINNRKPEEALVVFYQELVRMPKTEISAFRKLPVWEDRVQLAATISRELSAEKTYYFNSEKFSAFQKPTMLLLGGDSPSFVREATHMIDSALSNSKVVILPGQQHIAHYTNPELLAEAVQKFLLKDPLKMQVKVSGEGTPLVLVPGGLTGWASWEPFVETFTEQQRKVMRVQLLNVQYGLENRDLPGHYSVKMESRALAATLDSLGESKLLDIVAWSYGALVALDYALDHPDRIRTLALIEPPAFWVLQAEGLIDSETQHTLDFLKTMHGDITGDMLASFLKEAGLLKEGQLPQELPQWKQWVHFRQSLRNNSAILAHRDHLERLGKLEAPVLLIKGIGSGTYYHQIEDVLAARLPDALIVELPGAHAAHIVSRDQFLLALDNFQKKINK